MKRIDLFPFRIGNLPEPVGHDICLIAVFDLQQVDLSDAAAGLEESQCIEIFTGDKNARSK